MSNDDVCSEKYKHLWRRNRRSEPLEERVPICEEDIFTVKCLMLSVNRELNIVHGFNTESKEKIYDYAHLLI